MSVQNAELSAQETEVTTPVILTLVPTPDTITEADVVRRLTECADCE